MVDRAGHAEATLVRKLADRDEGASDALASLFREHAAVAYALARRVTRQDQLAEDVVQEAFLGLWHSPGSYRPGRGGVRSYLLAAVHHRAVDAVRREQTQRKRQDEGAAQGRDDAETDVAEEVADRAEQDEHRRRVSVALEGLPQDQRRVLTMMYFDGKSQRAIADELGVPLGTVKSRALLAMRKLRSVLEDSAWGELR